VIRTASVSRGSSRWRAIATPVTWDRSRAFPSSGAQSEERTLSRGGRVSKYHGHIFYPLVLIPFAHYAFLPPRRMPDGRGLPFPEDLPRPALFSDELPQRPANLIAEASFTIGTIFLDFTARRHRRVSISGLESLQGREGGAAAEGRTSCPEAARGTRGPRLEYVVDYCTSGIQDALCSWSGDARERAEILDRALVSLPPVRLWWHGHRLKVPVADAEWGRK